MQRRALRSPSRQSTPLLCCWAVWMWSTASRCVSSREQGQGAGCGAQAVGDPHLHIFMHQPGDVFGMELAQSLSLPCCCLLQAEHVKAYVGGAASIS